MTAAALVLNGALEVTARSRVEVTGGQLAALFWALADDEQAEFFSSLPTHGKTGADFALQMSRAADKTDNDGRAVMCVIGDMAK